MFLVDLVCLIDWIILNSFLESNACIVQVTKCNVTLAQSVKCLSKLWVDVQSLLAVSLGIIKLFKLEIRNGSVCVVSGFGIINIYKMVSVEDMFDLPIASV